MAKILGRACAARLVDCEAEVIQERTQPLAGARMVPGMLPNGARVAIHGAHETVRPDPGRARARGTQSIGRTALHALCHWWDDRAANRGLRGRPASCKTR